MKISDIISKKGPELVSGENEAEKLKTQRNELTQEMEHVNQVQNNKNLFKMTFVLENEVNVPVVFDCLVEELQPLMEFIDRQIIEGGVITIGEFKIVASRILYIDLQGR